MTVRKGHSLAAAVPAVCAVRALTHFSADDYCIPALTSNHDHSIVRLPWRLCGRVSLREPVCMAVLIILQSQVLLDILLSICKFEGVFLSTPGKEVLSNEDAVQSM